MIDPKEVNNDQCNVAVVLSRRVKFRTLPKKPWSMNPKFTMQVSRKVQQLAHSIPSCLTSNTSDLKEMFLRVPGQVYTVEGSTVEFECEPPASYPPANVTWFKDNKPVGLEDNELHPFKGPILGKLLMVCLIVP